MYQNVLITLQIQIHCLRGVFEGIKQPDTCNLKIKFNLRGKHIVSKLFCKQKNIFFLIMSWPTWNNFSLECHHQRFHFMYIFYDNWNEKRQKKLSSLQHIGHVSVYFTFQSAANFESLLWRSQRSNNLVFINHRYAHLCLCEVLKSWEPIFTYTKYLLYSISEKPISAYLKKLSRKIST